MESDVYTPTYVVPVGSGLPKLQRLRRLVRMCSRDTDGAYLGIAGGEDDIARRDLAHEVIERVLCLVGFALWRPKITDLNLVAVRLILVHPPIAHIGCPSMESGISRCATVTAL